MELTGRAEVDCCALGGVPHVAPGTYPVLGGAFADPRRRGHRRDQPVGRVGGPTLAPHRVPGGTWPESVELDDPAGRRPRLHHTLSGAFSRAA